MVFIHKEWHGLAHGCDKVLTTRFVVMPSAAVAVVTAAAAAVEDEGKEGEGEAQVGAIEGKEV